MTFIEFSSALQPWVLGAATFYIAWQQWKTNVLKVKSDMYERRIVMVRAVNEFLAVVGRNADASNEEIEVFLQKTRESFFLFGPDFEGYLRTIYSKALKLHYLKKDLDSELGGLPRGEERTKAVAESKLLSEWFSAQFDVVKQMAAPFLCLS